MTAIKEKVVTETIVYTLEYVPEEYAFLTDDAIAKIVNGEVRQITLHVRDYTYNFDTDCIEWLKRFVDLANGLLEELQ